jgi:hypothetical protein
MYKFGYKKNAFQHVDDILNESWQAELGFTL